MRRRKLLQLVLEAPLDRREAEVEEVPQDRLQAEPLRPQPCRPSSGHQAGHVVREVLPAAPCACTGRPSPRSGRCPACTSRAIRRPSFSFDSLVRPSRCGSLRAAMIAPMSFSSLPLFDAVGDRRDDDLRLLGRRFSSFHSAWTLMRALALLVDLAQRRPVGDDLAAEREVRPLDPLHQLGRGRVGVVDQVDAGADDLAEVVRRDVRRHADGDAGRRR